MTETAQQPSIARRLLPGLGWRSVTMVGGVVGGVVGMAAAARLLSKGDFAVYLVANSAYMITPVVAQLGLSRNAVRHIAQLDATGRHDEAMAYSRSVISAGAMIAPFTCLIAALALLIVHPPNSVAVVVLLWMGLLLETVRVSLGDVLLGHERQAWSAFCAYQPRVVGTAVVFGLLALAGLSLSLTTVLAIVVVTQIAIGVVSLVPARPYLRAPADQGFSLRRLTTEGLPFLGFDIGNFVLGRADLWIAAAVLVSTVNRAAYGAASTLAYQLVLPLNLPMLVASPIVRALWVERRKDELVNLVRGVASVATAAALVGFGLMAIFGSDVLRIVYGDSFTRGAGWLAILMIGAFVVVYTGASATVHLLCVGPRQACVVNLIWAALGVLFMWIGASVAGGTGLAIASTSSLAALNITQVYLVWRQTGIVTLPTLRPGPAIRSLRGHHESLTTA